MDLGRLINTANEAQEGRMAAEVDSGYEISSEDMFSIPVKRISKEMGKMSSREGRPIDLDRRNLISKVNEEGIDATKIAPIEKDNFWDSLMKFAGKLYCNPASMGVGHWDKVFYSAF